MFFQPWTNTRRNRPNSTADSVARSCALAKFAIDVDELFSKDDVEHKPELRDFILSLLVPANLERQRSRFGYLRVSHGGPSSLLRPLADTCCCMPFGALRIRLSHASVVAAITPFAAQLPETPSPHYSCAALTFSPVALTSGPPRVQRIRYTADDWDAGRDCPAAVVMSVAPL